MPGPTGPTGNLGPTGSTGATGPTGPTGASQIASSALGNAILGGATTGLAGGDVLKGALLGQLFLSRVS